MTVNNDQKQIIITQKLVDLQEKRVEKNKPEKFLQFLQAVEAQQMQFESEGCYGKFLQVLKKATIKESALYGRLMNLFRDSLGLPEKMFEEKVRLVGKDGSFALFPKELLELFYPFYRASFASTCRESVADENGMYKMDVLLSAEAIGLFKRHVYGRPIEGAGIEALKELSCFAAMIEDTGLQETLQKLVFEFFADDKNASLFDSEFMADHAPEFTVFYFRKKNINLENSGERGFAIGWKDFYNVFQEKGSKLLRYLVDQIDELIIGEGGPSLGALHLLPREYCRAIRRCTEIPSVSDAKQFFLLFSHTVMKLKTGNWLDELGKEVARNPEDYMVHTMLGSFLWGANRLDESEKHFCKAALHRDPKAAAFSLAGLGCIHSTRGKRTKAKEACDKSLELDPKGSSLVYACLNDLSKREGDDKQIETVLRKTIKVNPKQAFLYRELAWLLGTKDRLVEAEKAAKRAVELSPRSFSCIEALLNVCIKQGDFKQAIKQIYELQLLDPNDKGFLVACGRLERIQGDLNRSENSFRLAGLTPLQSLKAIVAVDLGRTLKLKGDIEAASNEFHAALQLDQNSASAHSGLAGCFAAKKEFKQAAKELSIALELNPKNPFVRRRLERIRSMIPNSTV